MELAPLDHWRMERITMDPLTPFGLFAVTAMLVFYTFERRSAWFILAFAGACALAAVGSKRGHGA